MTPSTHERTLSRTRRAPAIARQSLLSWFGAALDEEQLDTAKLLISELVSNAVVHGQGRITMRADLNDDRLVVEVIDQGEGFEREIRQHDFDDLHGRGLAIVDALSSRWGIHEGTTHVWFELERPGPRLGERRKPLA